MRYIIIILLLIISSCEKVVIIELPPSQNLIVVEGWVSDLIQTQSVRLIRSNGFLDKDPVQPITDASIRVERKNGGFQLYEYSNDGYYASIDPFAANENSEYRVVINLSSGEQIRSDWDVMSKKTKIESTSIRSFEENDPDNTGQQITLFYPKMVVKDSANKNNFYRWIFYNGNERYSEPESITLQDDRFFDGNFIPNTFDEFSYEEGDSIIVNIQSITSRTFDFLKLLKSQIATLGTSSITIPAVVDGNLTNLNSNEQVLGYFGTIAISADTIIAR